MDTRPDFSIFQGTQDLQLDADVTRQEEEEAEEDQKRRNQELHDLLTNAFDDLIDDDEDDLSTVNSSLHSQSHVDNRGVNVGKNNFQNPTNDNAIPEEYLHLKGAGDNPQVMQHYTHCFKESPFEDKNQQYQQTEYGSKEQLEVLYKNSLHEIQILVEQLQQLKETAATEKDRLYRRMALAEAEKERAILQLKHCSKQLESSKTKISEQEKELESFKDKLNAGDKLNMKLTGELEAAQLAIKDSEQKLSLIERDHSNTAEKFLHVVQQRHDKELFNLKDQVESVAAKFSAKDIECDQLKKQLVELTRTHEMTVVEKTDTINQLIASLEESQKQCQNLVLNIDNGKISAEKEALEKQVDKLKKEIDVMQGDLKHYEEMARLGLLGAEDSNSFSMNKKSEPSNDLNIRLRDELQRCLAGLRIKREEIKKIKKSAWRTRPCDSEIKRARSCIPNTSK